MLVHFCQILSRLPFGRTEHFAEEPDLSFLHTAPLPPSRSSRATSEPRSSHRAGKSRKTSSQNIDRAKSAERSVVARRKKASAPAVTSEDAWDILQDLRKKESKQHYR